MGEPLLVVGQGMAATRFVEELTMRVPERYDITVIGAEPHHAYNRVLLSSLLAGAVKPADIELRPLEWWARNKIATICGTAVTELDRAGKRVRLESGLELSYDKLVLATGSHAIRLPKPGMDLPGVVTFRVRADVDAMQAAAEPGRSAVVIGGGLLGLEAAYGLRLAGMKVTLLHLLDRLMERQLDVEAAALLHRAIAAKGIEVIFNADTARVLGDGKAEAIELVDGRVLAADLIVCAVGVRPNADLARAFGLDVARGVRVDDRLATSDPDIFALGECVEHRGLCYGLVEPAYEQAKVLARHLAGDRDVAYEGSVLATNLKVSGVSLFSAGDFLGEGFETITLEDPAAGFYRKLVVDKERLLGCVLYGETSDGLWYLDLIRKREDVSGLRADLIFGRTLALREAA